MKLVSNSSVFVKESTAQGKEVLLDNFNFSRKEQGHISSTSKKSAELIVE